MVNVGTIGTALRRVTSQRASAGSVGRTPRTSSGTPLARALDPQRRRVDEQRRVVDAADRGHDRARRAGRRAAGPAAVSLSVSRTSQPPGRRMRHASATTAGQSGTCSSSSPALTTSAQPSANGNRPHVGQYGRRRRARAACSQARTDQVDADVPVALAGDVRGEQPAAAAEVDQDRAVARRGRDQSGAGAGQPVQHRQRRCPDATTPRPARRTDRGRCAPGARSACVEPDTEPCGRPHLPDGP